MTGGSLGHGPAIAVGMALADRHDGNDRRTYCLVGDGELNEGSVWEAVALAGHLRLSNLTLVIDANGLQGLGPTADDASTSSRCAAKLEAFGWDVLDESTAMTTLRSRQPSAARRPAAGGARAHREGLRRRLHGGRADVALPDAEGPRTAARVLAELDSRTAA